MLSPCQRLWCVGAQVADLLLPLREMGFGEPVLAYHLWVLVFPIVWASLHKEEQVLLAKPMINLLSKEYHIKQLHCRPNVVQALLEGIRWVRHVQVGTALPHRGRAPRGSAIEASMYCPRDTCLAGIVWAPPAGRALPQIYAAG